MYADASELRHLCAVTAANGGFYAPHHRSYGHNAFDAYVECFELAQETGVALHLTHCMLLHDENVGRAGELIDLIDEWRSRGLDITLDSYPYTAGSGAISGYLPGWVQAGGVDATIARLKDDAVSARLRREMEVEGTEGFAGVPIRWDIIFITGAERPENQQWIGRTIADCAKEAGIAPFNFYRDLIVAEELRTTGLEFGGTEENVRTIMKHVTHMAGSDGIPIGQRPHPRGWGTFARYLGTYARDERVLSLEEVVRQMTSLPAQRLRQFDRGLVRPGMVADLVCFDPVRVKDTATFENPKQAPVGIPYVLVNGHVAVQDGVRTDSLSGRSVRS
jgi:N-acyl-D-amino-acid deacylase